MKKCFYLWLEVITKVKCRKWLVITSIDEILLKLTKKQDMRMTQSRDDLEEMLMLVLQENSTCSNTGNVIIREEMFFNIVERICDELEVEYDWDVDKKKKSRKVKDDFDMDDFENEDE